MTIPDSTTILPTDPAVNAVITHNVAPLRAEPRSDSEQVSQAILGDNVTLLEARGDFARVRMMDAYEGWVWQPHTRRFDPALPAEEQRWPFGQRLGPSYYVTADFAPFWAAEGQPETQLTKLAFGTWVQTIVTTEPQFATVLRVHIPLAGQELLGTQENAGKNAQTGFVSSAHIRPAKNGRYPQEFDGAVLCVLARRFLGTPYLWGGTTPFGFDCSGFVQRLYSVQNVILPRDAHLQIDSPLGARLASTASVQAGDLVFFSGQSDPRNRGITHVGMALDANGFIHALGKEGVTITAFDDSDYAAQYAYQGAWRYAPPVSP